ncbi:hypothetical protein [Parerythrobacter aestuarii]|uniref:hypothetical protein n=1 Tax=Parerythrobacter aestuarii TaxID=3020909 RepID=UPI0024DEF811|nr:hypothetical protein [Parerythrobacter aestuarii]
MTGIEPSRLKPSVIWRRTNAGILVEHGRRSFEMRGSSKVFSAVTRLLGLLDGTRSIDEIHQGIPEPVQSLLDRLVVELTSRNMLTASGEVPAECRQVPNEVVRLVQDRCEDWQSALTSWCKQDVRIFAPGELTEKIGRYCTGLGVHSVQGCEPDGQQLSQQKPLWIWVATNSSDAHRALEVGDCAGVVGAAMRGPLAALLSGEHNRLAHLPALLDKLPDLDEGLSEAVVSGFCALLAHEALQLHLQPFQDEDGRQANEMRLFRRDGSVRRLQLDAALLSSGPFDVDSASLAAIPQAEGHLAPLFDRDTRLMSWTDDRTPGVPFPLFHRSLALAQFGVAEHDSKSVCEWGLTPEEAENRAIRSALLEIARRSETHPVPDSYSPLLVEADESDALHMARALLAAQDHKLWNRSNQTRVELDQGCDAELDAMVRLARLFAGGRMPKLFVGSDPHKAAFVGTAEIAERSASRLSTTRDRALYEAIGTILSSVQRGTELEDCLPDKLVGEGGESTFVPNDVLEFSNYGFAVGRVRFG